MNDMLIINIIYTSKANFEVVKRREKLRFLTRERVHMKTLLTKVRPRPRLGSGLAKPKPEPKPEPSPSPSPSRSRSRSPSPSPSPSPNPNPNQYAEVALQQIVKKMKDREAMADYD